MRVIILAAGQGRRLMPLTKDKPKCMVKYKEKCIIDYILKVIKSCNIKNISIVTGYQSEVLEKYVKDKNINFYHNDNFQNTSMVYSLFCAENEMNDDIIISYGDIVYKKKVFEKLLDCKGEFVVVVDKNWKTLWKIRMKNPLTDAETMKIDPKGYIKEIGKIPEAYGDIDAQYVGLIKISKNSISKVKFFYHSLDKNKKYLGKSFFDLDMTAFIQLIIDDLMPVNAEEIYGGWFEIDTINDLKKYNSLDLI